MVLQNLIRGVLFGGLGLLTLATAFLIYEASPISWWRLAVALPLGLLGASIFLLAGYGFLAAILDWRYSRTHCPLCQKAVKVGLDGEF